MASAGAAPHEIFDLTVNLGHLITIGGIIITAALGYAALRNAVENLGGRADQLDTKIAELKKTMTERADKTETAYTLRADKTDDRIDNVVVDMKKMTDVLVMIGRQEERLTAMDQRMLSQGQRFDEVSTQLSRLREDYIALLADKAQRAIAERTHHSN